MIKVALVGVGGISGNHISAWDAMPNAALTALCDVRAERMARYGDKRCYTDFDELLAREQIDVLDICLPTYLHAEYALKAMERGIHVLCEKPVSLKKEEVARLYACAAEHRVHFMVAQVLRFWPEYELVRKLYREGTYGKLLSGSMTRLASRPGASWNNWMAEKERSRLVPFDLHIHDVDFLVYAFGMPEGVTPFRCTTPTQDALSAVYRFGDFFVTAEAAWYAAPYSFNAGFRFQFEHAVVAWEKGPLTIYEENGGAVTPLADGQGLEALGLPTGNAYANEIRYFASCVEAGRFPDKVKPEELVAVLDLLERLEPENRA